MLFYILYKLGYILSNILPLRAAYRLAETVAYIRYALAKKDREAVEKNLTIVLGKDISECRILARRVFRNFGLYLVDFFRMKSLTVERINREVEIKGVENLDGILKQNRGAILISCHLGNWEMGGVVVAMLGYRISAVALTHKYKRINDFFINQREEKGFKVISIGAVMKRCLTTLLNGELLALVGDRDFTNSGIVLDFFGVPTSLPKGPAILSLKTNSPILPVFFVRKDRFSYEFMFDKPIEPAKYRDNDKEEAIKKIAQETVAVMERYIRQYPEQWLVFRKFWETPIDAFVL